MWLAKMGAERIGEMESSQIGFDRLLETYRKKTTTSNGLTSVLKV
jgi:hypothetical protein